MAVCFCLSTNTLGPPRFQTFCSQFDFKIFGQLVSIKISQRTGKSVFFGAWGGGGGEKKKKGVGFKKKNFVFYLTREGGHNFF